jgi:hypothetical protein
MAELTMYPEWNHGQPFVIRGNEEFLTDEARRLQAEDDANARRQRSQVARQAVAATVAPVEKLAQVVTPLAEGVATEIKVTAFDLLHGTHLRRELHRQRRVRRITSFAAGIGILDVEPCAKHRKAMDRAEGLM